MKLLLVKPLLATLPVGQLDEVAPGGNVARGGEGGSIQSSCPQQPGEVLLQLVGVGAPEVEKDLEAAAGLGCFIPNT